MPGYKMRLDGSPAPWGRYGFQDGVIAVRLCRNPVSSPNPARSVGTAPSTACLSLEPLGSSGRPADADPSPRLEEADQSAMLEAVIIGLDSGSRCDPIEVNSIAREVVFPLAADRIDRTTFSQDLDASFARYPGA